MLRLPCPWCGARDEDEFRPGGPADIARPPADADDRAWAEYLYFRDNPSGPLRERWLHAFGCGRWFVLVRDTRTHELVDAATTSPDSSGTGST